LNLNYNDRLPHSFYTIPTTFLQTVDMPAIVVPEGYSYVLACIASTAWLNGWQAFKVGSARKAAQVKYPQLYAEKAEAEADRLKMKFNCTQRAHQNTLESLPTMLVG